jgi:hypothetical protein
MVRQISGATSKSLALAVTVIRRVEEFTRSPASMRLSPPFQRSGSMKHSWGR